MSRLFLAIAGMPGCGVLHNAFIVGQILSAKPGCHSCTKKTAQQLLLELRIPLFVTAGNLDLAFRWIRKDYRRYLAWPLDSGTMNYAFSYGSVRFISFVCDPRFDLGPHESKRIRIFPVPKV